VGFAVRRFGIPILPLILGVIIGPLMETKMREALDLSNGNISGLYNEPLAVAIYVLLALILLVPSIIQRVRGRPLVPREFDELLHDSSGDQEARR
jgi:putative tricarboxylic transport membrane protein